MRKLIQILKSTALVMATVVSFSANAEEVTAYPLNFDEAVQSLREDIPTPDEAPPKYQSNPYDQAMGHVRLGPPPTNEGIPDDSSPIKMELIYDAYTMPEEIQKVLKRAETFPFGQRIQFYEAQATTLVKNSNPNVENTLVRMILNRSVDLFRHTLPILGKNNEELARFLSNYFRQSFTHAAAFGNNLVTVLPKSFWDKSDSMGGSGKKPGSAKDDGPDFESLPESFRFMPSASFGWKHAVLLYRMSAAVSTTDAAKAVFLMKLLSYFRWDLENDMLRRSPQLKKIYRDIYDIQTSPNYSGILNDLASNRSPRSSDIAWLRSETYALIFETTPQRLAELKQLTDGYSFKTNGPKFLSFEEGLRLFNKDSLRRSHTEWQRTHGRQ